MYFILRYQPYIGGIILIETLIVFQEVYGCTLCCENATIPKSSKRSIDLHEMTNNAYKTVHPKKNPSLFSGENVREGNTDANKICSLLLIMWE